jgi:hypothetical protein
MSFNPNNVVVVASAAAAAAESVPGLRGGSSGSSLMNNNNKRDHFTNDDITINNSLPTISFELVGYGEEDFNKDDYNEDGYNEESSPSLLRGSRGLMTRDHFSNDDKIINISLPISYELLNYNEEARKVARLELHEALEAEYEHDVLVNNINEASQKNDDDDDEDSSSSTFAINDSMDDIHGVELASTVIDEVGLLRSTEVVDEDVGKDVDHDLD